MKKSWCIALVLLALSPITSRAAAVENIRPSVLFIMNSCKIFINESEEGIPVGGSGSGFLVGNSDHILTNKHVVSINCEDAAKQKILQLVIAKKIKENEIKNIKISEPEISIVLSPKEKISARVIWENENADLAVLKLDYPLSRPSVISFAKRETVKPGSKAFAVGFPGAAQETIGTTIESDLTPKITQGIISDTVQINNGVCLHQTDAPINEGNSGGPLLNEIGQVIGINSLKVKKEGVEGVAWAICIDEIIPTLKRLNIPYQDSGPGLLDHLKLSIEQSPGQTAAIALTLILVLGTLSYVLFTRRGRKIVVKGVEYSTTMIADALRRKPAPPTLPKASPPPATQPALRGLGGKFADQVFLLAASGDVISLGRDNTNQIVFPDNATKISRRHAEIRFDPQTRKFVLKDCGSTHGTFLDSGERLITDRPYSLDAGSGFYLGDQSSRFRVEMRKGFNTIPSP